MGKPQAPAPPDPQVTAAAQTASNIDTAIAQGYLNATNQNTPYGTVRYDQTGSRMVGENEVPQFTATTTLNPQYQKIIDSLANIGQSALDTGDQLLGNVRNTIATPFALNGLPPTVSNVGQGPLQTSVPQQTYQTNVGPSDFSADRRRVEDAMMSRFNEDWAKQAEDSRSRLNAQGIQLGSAGYDDEMARLDRARNDAMTQAILAGGQEQSRLFGLDLSKAQFGNQARGQQFSDALSAGQFGNQAQGQAFAQGQSNAALQNQARQQGISEQSMLRSQPINELATLLGFTPGIQTPQGPGFGGNVAGTDVMGAYNDNYAAQMANYQQKMAQQNALMGGLFGLGSAGIMASDIRLKSDIRRIGKTDKGLPIYLYTKDGKREVGVMAQDVEKVMPWAVIDMPNGFKAVNYEMVA